MTEESRQSMMRRVFLALDKRPRVHFYTSNVTKYLQARLVFEAYGLPLYHFKGHSDPYQEDYSVSKHELILRAINEVKARYGGRSYLFFVEDTTVRIDALSTETEDVPGLQVKEWFSNMTFKELDNELKVKGKGRGATVKSDIGLSIPGLDNPVYFSGETMGRVADSQPKFQESKQYPWLTPDSFNGWFIPDGAKKRLGEMSFEESWEYDFRIKSLVVLISRLEEYAAVLNLPIQSYSRMHHHSDLQEDTEQLALFPSPKTRRYSKPQTLIVIGHSCAGKTTFGEYVQKEYGIKFVEASQVMRSLSAQYKIDISDLYERAKVLMETLGPDVIARKILLDYTRELSNGLVITGFRTIEELEVIKTYAPNTQVILIEASERIRLQRHIARERQPYVKNLQEFRALDMQQEQFGLLSVSQDFSNIKIVNEGTLQDYFNQIDSVITQGYPKEIAGISDVGHPRFEPIKIQLYRCLLALDALTRPLTCTEIEDWTERNLKHSVRFNNANKVLKKVPSLVRRLELDGTNVRYEILNAGRAYLRLMKRIQYEIESTRQNHGS